MVQSKDNITLLHEVQVQKVTGKSTEDSRADKLQPTQPNDRRLTAMITQIYIDWSSQAVTAILSLNFQIYQRKSWASSDYCCIYLNISIWENKEFLELLKPAC